MTTNLPEEIFNLSIAERIQLAEDLWDSVAQQQELVAVTEAQKSELDRRLAKLETNLTEAHPWEDVKQRLSSRE